MTSNVGAISAHVRIATIEAKLGVGRNRGQDVRGSQAFDAVLARHATTSSSSSTSTLATERTATLDPSGAMERLLGQLGIEVTAPAPSTSAGTGALTGVPYADLFEAAGRRHDVDPAVLLAAVADAESNYDPTARSHAGAQGLMQLMPATAADLGVADPFDPTQAVDGAARLLSGHLAKYGAVDLALAAYNAGGGAVDRFGGIPPYSETQAYVPKVLDRYQELTNR